MWLLDRESHNCGAVDLEKQTNKTLTPSTPPLEFIFIIEFICNYINIAKQKEELQSHDGELPAISILVCALPDLVCAFALHVSYW